MFAKKKKQVEETQNVNEPVTNPDFLFKDNGKYENVFNNSKRTLKDLIAPSGIDTVPLNHVEIVSTISKFVKTLYVGTVPRKTTFARFLNGMYEFGSNNTSIHVIPIDEGKSINDLNNIINDLVSEMAMARKFGNINRESMLYDKKVEAERLRDEIAGTVNKLYEVSINTTLYADSLEQLEKDSNALKFELDKTQLGVKSAYSFQAEALKSNMPFNNNIIGSYHTFDRRSLATIFPFTASNICHEKGIPLGLNLLFNNVPILYDNFDPSLKNYNIVVFATSGAGKSYTIKMLVARSCTLMDIDTLSIDVEGEYGRLCEAIGGINIVLSSAYVENGKRTVINPFDVEEEIVIDEATGFESKIVNLENKVDDVKNVLLTMARGQTGKANLQVDEITAQIISEIVREEYDSLGITNEPDSLYRYSESVFSHSGTVSGGKVKKDMPTIGSWYKRLVKRSEEATIYKEHYEYLKLVMKQYVYELKGSSSFFDGQSTIDIQDNIPFINIDISKLSEAFQRPLAQQILLNWVWEKYVKKNSEDRKKAKKKRVIIDEAYMMLPFPEAVTFMNVMARRARKRNVSLCTVSQKFQDFYECKEAQAIITNADTKIFLQQSETDIDYVQEVFKLSDGEKNFLMTCETGEALLKVGKNTAIMRVQSSDYEKAYLESNFTKLAELNRASGF